MKYSPETLLEIFKSGSMTTEAQTAFDRLVRENPEFSEKVTQAMAERMGPVPASTLEQVTERLDAKFESLWVKNKPSKFARIFRISTKIFGAIGILGIAGLALAYVWPKLMAALPQIDLAHTNPVVIGEPKSEMAPPAMAEPTLAKHMAASLPRIPALRPKPVVSQPAVPASLAAKPNYNVQTGNSIRLVVDNDKSQGVQVTVLSPTGVLVRHLYLGHWDPGSHFVDWDGKADTGAEVAPGVYTVVVKTGSKTQSGVVTLQANH